MPWFRRPTRSRRGRPGSGSRGGGPLRAGVVSIEWLETRRVLAAYVPLAPVATPLWTTGSFAMAGTVDLQAAAAAAPDTAAGEAASLPRDVKITATGLPLLQSRAGGAGLEVFLDFSRDADGRGTFSLDADRVNFNFKEQLAIFNCWREITGFFSQFDVNITTVQPPTGPGDKNFAWLQITNDFDGGVAYVGWLSKDGPKGTNNSGDAVNRVSGLAHEIGHLLNMSHQAEFDKYGNLAAEYSDGTDYRNRALMGVDYMGEVRKLLFGRVSDGSDGRTIQDDVAKTSARIAAEIGGSGMRPDDYGSTFASAYRIAAGGQQLDGFTERDTDVDVFRIDVTAAGPWTFSATPLYYSQAEPKLELLTASGTILAARDDADYRNGPTNEQNLTVALEPGTYYVRVAGGGDYDELGYYKFAATPLPTGFTSADVGVPRVHGSVIYDGTSGVFTQSAGGADIWGTSDQFRFTSATLTGNGSITARVDALDNIGWATKGGVMIRQSLDANSPHAFLGIRPDGTLDSIWRGSAGGGSANVNNSGPAPWVRITRSGNQFTFSSSADGVTWTTLGSRTIAMSGPVYVGLATCGFADARFEAFATFSNLTISGNITLVTPPVNGLTPPTAVTAAPAAGANTSINVSWTASAGASGYVIERSLDGVDYGQVATVGASITSYTDADLWGSMRWFYRVRASNGTSVLSAASTATSTVNKPAAPTMSPGGYTPTVMAIGTSELFLNWFDTSGEVGYRVERSTNGTSFSTVATLAANQTATNVAGLAAGTAYTFRITPLTNLGDRITEPLLITTQTRMPAVSNLRVSAATTSTLTVSWNDSSLETGTRVERSTDGVTWSFLGNAATNATSWTDRNLAAGQRYSYRVMPFNQTFDGIMSGSVAGTTLTASLPPTVATPAAATPATVTGVTTRLTVLGADDGGEANLTYTWAATGPGSVSFLGNGKNTSKTTTAVFTKPGSYTFTVTITDAAAMTTTSSVSVTVVPTATSIAAETTMAAGSSQQLVVLDQFGGEIPPGTWAWTATAGVVSSTGLFTAPASGNATVVVTTESRQLAKSFTIVPAYTEIVFDVPAGETLTDTTLHSGTDRLVKRGGGTLILSTPNAHAEGTVVEAGDLIVRNPYALGTGPLEILADGQVRFEVGGQEVPVGSLSLAASGRLDLGAARLAIAVGGYDLAGVRGLLVSGRNGGSWTGPGLTSSAVAGLPFRELGYRVTVEGGLVVQPAAVGDANLDGSVNVQDLIALSAGGRYGTSVTDAHWWEGDFTYDGRVSIADLIALVSSGLYGTGPYGSAPRD
jgi:autotransporter-associated beta strand protein